MSHEITIGTDPEATAAAHAALIRGDVRSGAAVRPPADVRFSVGSPDESLSPAALAAKKKGNCGSFPRAIAPFIKDASHVGVQRLTLPSGEVQHHAFLVLTPPGAPPVQTDGAGRAVSSLKGRVHDECVDRGMNDGTPLGDAFYENAWVSPIWPSHLRDLRHLAATPAERAEAGLTYQGIPRRHVPTTREGEDVAGIVALASRAVTPPADYDPLPHGERYARRALREVQAAEEAALHKLGMRAATPRMAAEFVSGVERVALGQHPTGGRLDGDPAITETHRKIAKDLHDTIRVLQGGPDVPPDAARLLEQLVQHGKGAKGDHVRTIVSEIHAVLPGAVPEHVARHLAPAERARGGDDDEFLFAVASAAPSAAILGLDDAGLDLAGALAMWSVCCCIDGHCGRECNCGPARRRRPGRRSSPARPLTTSDPFLGAVQHAPPPSGGGGGGGGGGGVSTPRGGASIPSLGSPGGGPGGSLGGGPFGRGTPGGGTWTGGGGGDVFGFGPPRGGWSDGVISVDDGDDDEDGGEEVNVVEVEGEPTTTVIRRAPRVVEVESDPILVQRRPRVIYEDGGPDRHVRRRSWDAGRGYRGGYDPRHNYGGRPPPPRPGYPPPRPGLPRPGASPAPAGARRRGGTLQVQSNVYTNPSDQAPSTSKGIMPANAKVWISTAAPVSGPGGGNTHAWIMVTPKTATDDPNSTGGGYVWQEVVTQLADASTYDPATKGAASDAMVLTRHEGIDDPILGFAGATIGSVGHLPHRRHHARRRGAVTFVDDLGDEDGESSIVDVLGSTVTLDDDPPLGYGRPLPCPTGTCRR